MKLLSVQKVSDLAPHSAFTDLARYRGKWICAFRESDGHWEVGEGGVEKPGQCEGIIRLMKSADGEQWNSFAELRLPGVDLRDPHLSVTPSDQLMVNMGGRRFDGDAYQGQQSYVSFLENEPVPVYRDHEWIWRITWYKGVAYGVAYGFSDPLDRRSPWNVWLVRSEDGLNFERVTKWELGERANETTLRFHGDQMWALVRRDTSDRQTYIGRSIPPYTEWDWQSIGVYLGSPDFCFIGDTLWACGREVRFLCEKPKTMDDIEAWVSLGTIEDGIYQSKLVLPSEGDCAYPGLICHEEKLWMSYYSSHEGKAAIYFAKIAESDG